MVFIRFMRFIRFILVTRVAAFVSPFAALAVGAFGVTFFSLVGQGLLLSGALRSMGLIEQDPVALDVAEQQARLISSRAAHHVRTHLHPPRLPQARPRV